jgi:uncharacterized membrane protein
MVRGNYIKSAPIRRLRHPLEESPLWSILGGALAGILALVVGLPVLFVVSILIPFCLLGRWLLLFIFWNRQTSAATQGTPCSYIYIYRIKIKGPLDLNETHVSRAEHT